MPGEEEKAARKENLNLNLRGRNQFRLKKEETEIRREEKVLQLLSMSSSSSSTATASTAPSSPPPRGWLGNASLGGTERGPPNEKEMKRSAYLLKPESEADMGQSLQRLPSSSSSSSSLPEDDCVLGRGRLVSFVSWDVEREGGGNFPPPQVSITANNNDSYSPAMPRLPRSAAHCIFTGDDDDQSGCTMKVGREKQGDGGNLS